MRIFASFVFMAAAFSLAALFSACNRQCPIEGVAQPPLAEEKADMKEFPISYTVRSGGYSLVVHEVQPYGSEMWVLAEVLSPPEGAMVTQALEELTATVQVPATVEDVRVFVISTRPSLEETDYVIIKSAQTFWEQLRTTEFK